MEKKEKSGFRRNDIVLIALLLAVSAAACVGIRLYQERTTKRPVAVVVENDREIGRFLLDEDRELRLDSDDGGYNVFVIKDGEVTMTEASCPDQICVRHTPIRWNGEMIVCLPHELIIQIENAPESDVDGRTN